MHILLARQTLARWGSGPQAPFDVRDDTSVNAFMHGSLAPDMGNFPGGSRALARLVHTRRTGQLQRALLERAATQEEHAFALGWLAHIIADVLIHPLVNEDADRRAQPGAAQIVEHVRVEVGLDVWFCWQHPALRGVRLTPAFDSTGYRFLADTLNSVIDAGVTAEQLTRMERGLIMFSHGALHFATTVARRLSWRDDLDVTVPFGSALVWHTASRLSPVNSVVNAYLNPYVPEPRLIRRVESALRSFDGMLDAAVADGAAALPDYDLEDGTIRTDQRVA
ncbi:MAG TPA: zinc dependent phospholipase C family protein [Longimicrobiales bacterium]|nr:zinc dependent phospholipase C family protein [Longimicrobiales bacterium]